MSTVRSNDDGFQRIDRLDAGLIDQLVDLYQGEWWTRGRARADVETMLAGSDLLYAYTSPAGELAAFARVLTDGVYKALVFDVIVRPEWRDRGLGARLLESITADPRLAAVRHIELYCLPDLVPFYARFGFTGETAGTVFLRRSA